MSVQSIMVNEKIESKEEAEGGEEEIITDNNDCNNNNKNNLTAVSRKERRKEAKKEKRKKKRKEMAEMERLEEEARLNDPEEQLRLQAEEERERARAEIERIEFEEREKKILEEWERRRVLEEEERRRAREEKDESKRNQVGAESNEDEDGWESVEEGPPEVIFQGNEIIIKKKTIRVKKKEADHVKEDPNRPTSNPFPPQSEAFANYQNASDLSAQQLLKNVAEQTPNFGTELDRDHCPFHFKTGACRFGSHCSRIHFYPDKSCTLLMKNMYSGPGLAWEQDEGLECTDDEVELAFEEFYEDVHTEFLKYGEIINFKVCRNGSSHLRGNVYVHYVSLDSAVLAYQSMNGRYFGGKMVQCEFVGVTRWKVAICGEFMKSKFKTCSRGMTCNFIHCFRNPGGDYEWADWDRPPPRYWVMKMAALFGHSGVVGNDKQIESGSPRPHWNFSRISPDDADRYRSRRSQSREVDHLRRFQPRGVDRSRRSLSREVDRSQRSQSRVIDHSRRSEIDHSRSSKHYSEDEIQSSAYRRHRRSSGPKHAEDLDEKQYEPYDHRSNSEGKERRRNASVERDSDKRLRKQSRTDRNGKLASRGSQSDGIIDRDNENVERPDADRYPTRNTRQRHKRSEFADAGHGVSSNRNCLDEAKYASRNPEKASISIDDRWDGQIRTSDDDLFGDWSDWEADTTYHTDKSERSGDYEELQGKISETQCANTRYGEAEHDNYSRSYELSDSRSRYRSRKDRGNSLESKRGSPDDFSTSKRRTDIEESCYSERRIKNHKRGRREPE